MRSISRLSGSPIAGPGAAKAPAAARASLISWAPALPCLKLINITGYLGWRSAPAPYQPLTSIYQQNKRQTDTHTHKKIERGKKNKPPHEAAAAAGRLVVQAGMERYCPLRAGTPKNERKRCSGCFLCYQKPPSRCNRLSKPPHRVPPLLPGGLGGSGSSGPSIPARLQPGKARRRGRLKQLVKYSPVSDLCLISAGDRPLSRRSPREP